MTDERAREIAEECAGILDEVCILTFGANLPVKALESFRCHINDTIIEATAEKEEQLKKAVEALKLISEMDGDKGAYHYTLASETLKELGVE